MCGVSTLWSSGTWAIANGTLLQRSSVLALGTRSPLPAGSWRTERCDYGTRIVVFHGSLLDSLTVYMLGLADTEGYVDRTDFVPPRLSERGHLSGAGIVRMGRA